MIPDSKIFIVPKAGHNVFELEYYGARDEVDEANEAILEFLLTE